MSKPWDVLTHQWLLKFNGGLILESAQGVTLSQEYTCASIRTIQNHNADTTSLRGKIRKDVTLAKQYVAQCALGTYIASMC